jgi:hypothetical protein
VRTLKVADDYDALQKTAEILSDDSTMAALWLGLGELERGKTIEFDDLRRESAERRLTK